MSNWPHMQMGIGGGGGDSIGSTCLPFQYLEICT
jgi:hypothetical protein